MAVVPDAWDIGFWHTVDEAVHVPPARVPLPGSANLSWAPLSCACGMQWVQLITSRAVFQGDAACVAMAAGQHMRAGLLCLQADSSVKNPGTPFAAAGAGVVAWHVDPCGLDTRLFDIVHPLLTDTTSMEAEAAASILAVEAIPAARAAAAKLGLAFSGAPLIQADNSIIARHWGGDARIRRASVSRRIEDAWTKSIFTGTAPVWEAIPRELNSPADKAAGDASALALDALLLHDPELTRQQRRGPFRRRAPDDGAGLATCPRQAPLLEPVILEIGLAIGSPGDYSGEHAAAMAASVQANPCGALLLLECPLLTAGAWALARQVAGGRRDVLEYIYAVAEGVGCSRSGMLALYECKALSGQGRMYALWTAARFPKAVQLALFGATHTEFDIVGCHLAFFLIIANALGELEPWETIRHVREWLAAEARLDTADAKFVARLVVTAGSDTIRREIEQRSGTWTADVQRQVELVQSVKPTVLRHLHARGFLGNEEKLNDSNMMYFALEAVEGYVMRRWVSRIMARSGNVSCLLKGDGVWIDSSVPASLVAQAFHEAVAHTGFPALTMRATDLQGAAAAHGAPTAAALAANAMSRLFAPLETQGVAPRLGGAPRQPFMDFLDHVRHPAHPRWPGDS